jgi:hypothetical protein
MKKITVTIIAAATLLSSAFAQNIDSLQKRNELMQSACAQADDYINKADSLIQYNQPKTKVINNTDATLAGNYVLKAIQISKKYDDTVATRNNFDRLGRAYVMQNKFTEAKWYFLQSNCISRDRHDVTHIINGLLELAEVKSFIKDYALAQKDLQEAIVLSKYSYNMPLQIEVERKLAALYDRAGKLKEAKAMVQHYTLLAENLKKAKAQQLILAEKTKKAKAQQLLTDNLKKAKDAKAQQLLADTLKKAKEVKEAKAQQLLAMQKVAKAKSKKIVKLSAKQGVALDEDQTADNNTNTITASTVSQNN